MKAQDVSSPPWALLLAVHPACPLWTLLRSSTRLPQLLGFPALLACHCCVPFLTPFLNLPADIRLLLVTLGLVALERRDTDQGA